MAIEIKSHLDDVNDNVNDEVLEKIKGMLKTSAPDDYNRWKDSGFDINHAFEYDFNYGNEMLLANLYGYNIQVAKFTLLHWASASGHYKMVEFLVGKGADVNSQECAFKQTPLKLACMLGDTHIIGFGKEEKQIYIASRPEFEKVAEFLVMEGANVNAVDERSGGTPLYSAVVRRNEKIAEILLDNGANINEVVSLGYGFKATVLYSTITRNDQEMAELLISKGANVDLGGSDTPLSRAAEENNKEMVEFLLRRGANVNAQGEDGRTPLCAAAAYPINRKEMVEFLLGVEGIDPSIKSEEGKIAAEYTSSDEIMELLRAPSSEVQGVMQGLESLRLDKESSSPER